MKRVKKIHMKTQTNTDWTPLIETHKKTKIDKIKQVNNIQIKIMRSIINIQVVQLTKKKNKNQKFQE